MVIRLWKCGFYTDYNIPSKDAESIGNAFLRYADLKEVEKATKEAILFNLKDTADKQVIDHICQDIMIELIDNKD